MLSISAINYTELVEEKVFTQGVQWIMGHAAMYRSGHDPIREAIGFKTPLVKSAHPHHDGHGNYSFVVIANDGHKWTFDYDRMKTEWRRIRDDLNKAFKA